MYAVVTDTNYRMSLALMRDLADKGIKVIACYPGQKPPFPAQSKAVTKSFRVPDVRTRPKDFLDALYKICDWVYRTKAEKPALLPVGTMSIEQLCKADVRQRFDPVCGIALPTEENLTLANNKNRVMELCSELGILAPRTYKPESREDFVSYEYPLIVKPICGEKQGLSAEDRYVIARDAKAASDAWEHFCNTCGETIVQQYIENGTEVTCSSVADHGKIITMTTEIEKRMLPISGGPGCYYYTDNGDRFRPSAEKLIKALDYSGVICCQYIFTEDGRIYLMEINPRVWGYYPIVREADSSFSYDWYAVSIGKQTIGKDSRPGVDQYYLPSDAYRALMVLKSGKPGSAIGHAGAWLNPRNHEALFEWKDLKASLGYISYYLKKGAEK